METEDHDPGDRGRGGEHHHSRVVNTWHEALLVFLFVKYHLLWVFGQSRAAPEIIEVHLLEIN